MADDRSIVRDRFDQAMQRARDCAVALSIAQKSHIWNDISKNVDGIRKKGNIMGQSKGLTQTEVTESINSYARKFGEKSDE